MKRPRHVFSQLHCYLTRQISLPFANISKVARDIIADKDSSLATQKVFKKGIDIRTLFFVICTLFYCFLVLKESICIFFLFKEKKGVWITKKRSVNINSLFKKGLIGKMTTACFHNSTVNYLTYWTNFLLS